MKEGRKKKKMTSHVGIVVLFALFICVAYILGFSQSIKYMNDQMHRVLDFDLYRTVIQELHMDVIKEKEEPKDGE